MRKKLTIQRRRELLDADELRGIEKLLANFRFKFSLSPAEMAALNFRRFDLAISPKESVVPIDTKRGRPKAWAESERARLLAAMLGEALTSHGPLLNLAKKLAKTGNWNGEKRTGKALLHQANLAAEKLGDDAEIFSMLQRHFAVKKKPKTVFSIVRAIKLVRARKP